jgi:adenylosuccinate lyase
MNLSSLTALSPLDGRYAEKTESLRLLFSEYALMRYRVLVEIRWLIILQPKLSSEAKNILEHLYLDFNEMDAARIKNIEKTTNHDVKAIEYFIKEKIENNSELNVVREWIHFGCTSDDINNLAYGLMLQTARSQILLPYLDELINVLKQFSHQYADCAMLSRTHGQKATPTTVGKEFANVLSRLKMQSHSLTSIKLYGKINGAVGNFNAHTIVFPEKNWSDIAKNFVESLGLEYQAYTTQIEPHDYMAEFFHNLVRIHNILIDFCRDCWGYISIDYFQQKSLSQEVGSSTMPHKINPIDFENAEGNLYLSNSLLNCLAEKLCISRFQRDLVDSTLLRNIGVGFGYASIAYQSLLKGISKIEINKNKMEEDLNQSWEILAEPIQMMMRVHGVENAYEKLKDLTRGKLGFDRKTLHQFIDELSLSQEIKNKLKDLKPKNYVGIAGRLAREI